MPGGSSQQKAPDLTLQRRIEESAVGRSTLSAVIVVTLVAIVAINLPGSDLRAQLLRAGQPYLNVLGLDQNWALFAPDPRRVAIDVTALVRFDDGTMARWRFPHGGALLGAYRDYRWRKWEEGLIIDPAASTELWHPAALWAASRVTRPGHSVSRVTLLERYAPIAAPGVEPRLGTSRQRTLYKLALSPTTAAAAR